MLKIDLHIHTIFSGHAFATFYEIISYAQQNKMQMIAITDHGPSLADTQGELHFHLKPRVPKDIGGVRILYGCEANVISENGDLDLPEHLLKTLDIILFCLHSATPYEDLGILRNTKAMINAMKNPYLRILTHPFHPGHPYDAEQVIHAAIDRGIVPELNLSYLRNKENGVATAKRLVEIAKDRKVKLIVNSDAHFLHELGDDDILAEHWDTLGINNELILNSDPEELKEVLGINY